MLVIESIANVQLRDYDLHEPGALLTMHRSWISFHERCRCIIRR
jgi:hypothetical protein